MLLRMNTDLGVNTNDFAPAVGGSEIWATCLMLMLIKPRA